MNTYIDIHILQTVPPSNINRDDTGSPKSAVFGGIRRARVSSQAWKRPTRLGFADEIGRHNLGSRTTRVIEMIAEQIIESAPHRSSEAVALAAKVAGDVGLKAKKARASKNGEEATAPRTEYLVFVSPDQVQRLAEAALTEPYEKKAAKEVMKSGNSIDLALFGRMVADDANLNVDASVQVAHAISTHEVAANEFDYFTAVDDENPAEETGAGMIGTIEFNSSTLYRYANINVGGLIANLGDYEAAALAARAFTASFITSMPTGKQNTFANRTPPDLVLICVRSDQPINLVGAFEDPVIPERGTTISTLSGQRLLKRFAFVTTRYGVAPSEAAVWVGSPDLQATAESYESLTQATTIDQLADLAANAVGRRDAQ